jgi:hypothetical protein
MAGAIAADDVKDLATWAIGIQREHTATCGSAFLASSARRRRGPSHGRW